MSMQNSIYGGVPGPSWYVFDKIHLGSAISLINHANNDGVYIGRYVLVKYCDGLLDNDERAFIEELAHDLSIKEDNENLNNEDKLQYFIHCREDNSQQAYDRVVFQKVYSKTSNKITYHPICNLHAIQNIIISPEEGSDINYSAENICLNADIILAGKYDSIGNLKVGDTISRGTSLQKMLSDMLQQRLNPQITPPSIQISLKSGQAGAHEAGTILTPEYTVTLSPGKYEYGPATAVQATSWVITDTKGNVQTIETDVANKHSGKFSELLITDALETNKYSIGAEAEYSDGVYALDNLGDQTELFISAGKISNNSDTITSYRSFFYGAVTKDPSELTSADIRALRNGGNYNGSKTGLEIKANDATNLKAFVIAIPGTNTRGGVTKVESTAGMIVDVTPQYGLSTTIKPQVADCRGTNGDGTLNNSIEYKLWIWKPSEVDPGTVHKFNLG